MNKKAQKFWNYNFSLLALRQVISLFANNILYFAISLYLLDTTGSSALFGTVTAFSMLPMVLLTPFGGILADRVNRRNLIIAFDGIASVFILIFAFFSKAEIPLYSITMLLVVLAILESFYTPAIQACIPVLQPEENLIRANALVSQIAMLANILGPVIGGFLYGIFGLAPIVIVSGVCFLLCMLTGNLLHIPFQKQLTTGSAFQVVKSDFKEGASYILNGKGMVALLGNIAVLNFLVASLFSVGFPYIVRVVLGFSSQSYGISMAFIAVSGIVGGVIAGTVGNRFPQNKLNYFIVLAGLSLLPIGFGFFMGISPIAIFILTTLCIMGTQIFTSIFSILIIAVVQKNTPNHLLGKVLACISSVAICAEPLGRVILGFLLEAFSNSIGAVFIIVASLTAIIGATSAANLRAYVSQATAAE